MVCECNCEGLTLVDALRDCEGERVSGCIVEIVTLHRASCSVHGPLGPIRGSEAGAREDVEHHVDVGGGE